MSLMETLNASNEPNECDYRKFVSTDAKAFLEELLG